MPAPQSKSYAMSRFQVTVDGHQLTNFVKSVEGGLIKTESTTNLMGPYHIPVRNVTTRTVDPISLAVGMSGTGWVMGVLESVINNRLHNRVEGEILHADVDSNIRFRQGFQRGLVTEIGLPALDASSKDSAYVTVKIQPELVTFDPANGPKLAFIKETKQKLWNTCNFRLNLERGGKKVACDHVTKIEAISVKVGTKAHQSGKAFLPEYTPTKMEVGKLGVTLPLYYATDFITWYRETVSHAGSGNKPDQLGYEATGSIEYLDPTCTQTLYSINLLGVAPENFTITKTEGSSNNPKMCKFDLYLSSIKVSKSGLG